MSPGDTAISRKERRAQRVRSVLTSRWVVVSACEVHLAENWWRRADTVYSSFQHHSSSQSLSRTHWTIGAIFRTHGQHAPVAHSDFLRVRCRSTVSWMSSHRRKGETFPFRIYHMHFGRVMHPTVSQMDCTFGSDSPHKFLELKIMCMVNMSTGFEGVTAVPANIFVFVNVGRTSPCFRQIHIRSERWPLKLSLVWGVLCQCNRFSLAITTQGGILRGTFERCAVRLSYERKVGFIFVFFGSLVMTSLVRSASGQLPRSQTWSVQTPYIKE